MVEICTDMAGTEMDFLWRCLEEGVPHSFPQASVTFHVSYNILSLSLPQDTACDTMTIECFTPSRVNNPAQIGLGMKGLVVVVRGGYHQTRGLG